MPTRELAIVIKAMTKGAETVKSFATGMASSLNQAKAAMTAFNKAAGDGKKAVGVVQGQVTKLITAFASFQAVTRAVNIMKAAELGSRSMAGAVEAANKEFKNIGGIEDWEGTVRKLSGELVIYSDTALKKAIAGTIDMTKYLGLSGEQMAEIVRRAGNLAAGKMELGEAIAKVTAAMRGEARGAGQLGLVLREEYVKSWYEANRTTAKAWGDLTELEKVQVRYNVFLEQTNTKLGKAAGYALTFAGGIEMIRTEIENAVIRNRDLMVAVNELGAVLREHAGGIGSIVATLVRGLAIVIKWTVEWKELLVALGATYVAVTLISKLAAGVEFAVRAVNGFRAAWIVLTGETVLVWLANVRAALAAVAAGAGIAAIALNALAAGAAAWGIVQVAKLIQIIVEWRKQEGENQKIAERSRAIAEANKVAITDEHKARLAALKTKIESGAATAAEVAEYRKLLKASIEYTGGLLGVAVARQKTRGEIETLAAEQAKYIKELHAATDASKRCTAGLAAQAEAAPLTKEQLDEVRKSVDDLGKSYGEQEKKISEFYDLALDRAKREGAEASAGSAAIVKVNEEKLRNLLDLAERERTAAIAVIRDRVTNEIQAAVEIAGIEKDLTEKKKGYYRDAAKELTSTLDQALKQERDYAEKAKSHRSEASQIERNTAETIRGLKRQTMTEAEQSADREKEIEEKRAALRKALVEQDYSAAKGVGGELVSLYREQYSAAAASGKKAIQDQALAGIRDVGGLMAKSERDQAKAAEEKREAETKRIEDLSARLEDITGKMTELSRMEIAPALAIDTAAVDRLIAKLDGIPREIRTRHVIEEVSLAAKRFGGFIQAMARGGKLPGWGGGDIVRALLEPGEFVIKKEAVKKYGAGLFDMLNQMRLNLPRALLAGMPSLAPAGGGSSASAGKSERLEVHFRVGGKVFEAELANRKSMDSVRSLMEELNRGEYSPGY